MSTGGNLIFRVGDGVTVIGTDEQVSALRADIEKEADMLVHDHSDHEMHMYRYHVEAGGPLCGLAIRQAAFDQKHNAMIIAIERGGQRIVNPDRDTVLLHDDQLWFVSPDNLTLAGFEKKMVEV